MTTSPVMTLTDELLREFDSISEYDDDDNKPVAELRSVVGRLTAELRRLRAEKEELAQSLAESRANDQAAMGWLTSLRWASGDRGERMLPELVSHVEGLAKDAGRLEWVVKNKQMRVQGRDDSWFVLDCGNGLTFVTDRKLTYREAIDYAIATQ